MEDLTELRLLADQATKLAEIGEADALRQLARDVWIAFETQMLSRESWDPAVRRIVEDLDSAYEQAFPVVDWTDPYHLIDAPWPTTARDSLLDALVGDDSGRRAPLEPLAEPAIATGDVPRLRLLATTLAGSIHRETVVRILDALHAADALAAEVVEAVFFRDQWIGRTIRGQDPSPESHPTEPAKCVDSVRDHVDGMFWRLPPDPPAALIPMGFTPCGLRFVLRALEQPDHLATLGKAELTDEGRSRLVTWLADQPAEVRERAFELRLEVGDADVLLPLLGLPGAGPLLRLIQAADVRQPERQDRAEILSAVREAGGAGTRELLRRCPSELISAALGWNRAAVTKRVTHNALQGIAAYGLLPLADGETVLDRYLALREVCKRGEKLGPNRRHSHAAAVAVALDHLAQVAGYPDPERLEWDCEARLATATPKPYRVGDYTVELSAAEPAIVVTKAGKRLKSVPKAVRSDPRYDELAEHQVRMRAQASRLRTGLIERLVRAEGTLSPDELDRLRQLPAGAALLPKLIWRDRHDTLGPLDQVDATAPVTAVHPYTLYERGVLSRWQAEVVRRRLAQPVKQAFRELYLLTPAERAEVDTSPRFAGHTVAGKVAAQLLSRRGWATHGEYDDHQATRPVDGRLTAALRCDFLGYFGLGDVLIGDVRFLAEDGVVVPLVEVPPVLFSEVMRDLDLVVSVAGADPGGYTSPPQADSRAAQLLAALIEDLGLDRVHVDGTSAVVRGSRATYRVHLTSGSIHVEPAGYLCVAPKSFGNRPHRRLFLPFADPDQITSVILSKVLLLAEDEKITDPSILRQLDNLT